MPTTKLTTAVEKIQPTAILKLDGAFIYYQNIICYLSWV